MTGMVAGSPRSKLASVFKINDIPPPPPAPGLASSMALCSARRPVTVIGSSRGSPAPPVNREAMARISHNHQRDRLKAIMQTMGSSDGQVATSDLLLSARLAKIDLPEEFLLKTPYAKQYAANWDGATPQPDAIKWRPFYDAIAYPKMQSKDEWSKNYAAREAKKAADKIAAEKAAADKAAAEAAALAPPPVAHVERPYVSEDELRRAHAVIKSRLTTQFGDLRAAFRKIDTDGSGRVTHEEAVASLAVLNLQLPMRIMQRIVDVADYDGDGDISFAEFARVLTSDDIMMMKDSIRAGGAGVGFVDSRMKGPSIKKAPRVIKDGVTEDDVRLFVMTMKEKLLAKYTRLDTAFKQIDEDRSGYLTRDEFKFLMKVVNLDGTNPKIVEVLIDLMDSDGDGQIKYQEFTHLLSADDPINTGPLAAKVQAVYKKNH